jgi:hypothetical protein
MASPFYIYKLPIYATNPKIRKENCMNPIPEIGREKIFIPAEMTSREIQEQYGLSKERSWIAKKKGFFVKNYSKKQVVIDPGSYDPATSYSAAVVSGITATSGGPGMVRGGGAAVYLIIKSGEIIGLGLIFESI